MTPLIEVQPQERDRRGRFLRGNRAASAGGRARALRLDADRRRQIGALGRAAVVRKHFMGDDTLQRRYWSELGAYVYDVNAGAYDPQSPLRPIFSDPGPIRDWLARQFTVELWTVFTLADVPEMEF